MELEEAQGATLRERPRSAHWTFAGHWRDLPCGPRLPQVIFLEIPQSPVCLLRSAPIVSLPWTPFSFSS